MGTRTETWCDRCGRLTDKLTSWIYAREGMSPEDRERRSIRLCSMCQTSIDYAVNNLLPFRNAPADPQP